MKLKKFSSLDQTHQRFARDTGVVPPGYMTPEEEKAESLPVTEVEDLENEAD